jgi:hypothetical protein
VSGSSAARISSAPPSDPERPPVDDPGYIERPWGSATVLLAICVVVLFVAGRDVWSNATWWRPFFRDFVGWLADPRIAGGSSAPARPVLGLAILLVVWTLGWLATRRLLLGTDLAGERPLVGGLSIALGLCVLGYGAMVAVIFGWLSAPMLLLFIGLVAGGLVVSEIRARHVQGERIEESAEVVRSPSPRLRRITAALAAAILLATFVHAALSPVQEWDATVYHAETARRWFMKRPDPPLEYGPSIGYEISGNYPPLFSASGAAIYTLLGRFDDFYLRLLPPLLFLAILLMTFGYTRRRLGEDAACYAVLLLLGTPLMVMYGAWPTDYILLTAMLLATVILADVAAHAEGVGGWVGAGVIAGFAILSHVYGLAALAVVVAAMALRANHATPRRRAVRGPPIALAMALAVASPWLLRNLVLLGDPLYPLASPPFHGKGLIQPFWDASREQIKNAALYYWETAGKAVPRLAETTTALFDQHLLPVGLYFGLLLGAVSWRRMRTLAYLAIVLVALLGLLLLPGWYWLRAILPALPVAAILTGAGFARVLEAGREMGRASTRPGRVARGATVVTAVAVLGAGGGMGLALAIAGPNQSTWTTNLSRRDDLMRSVENLGSTPRQLWTTFGGDVELWGWFNEHMDATHRVATLEIRTYYLNEPGDLFYLDGREAGPLLTMDTPAEAARYLQREGVRYVAIPAWSVNVGTKRPFSNILPLYRYLGSSSFPAIAAFPVRGTGWPSLVYAVGPVDVPLAVGVYPGALSPPADNGSTTFPAGQSGMRLLVPDGAGRHLTLSLAYRLAPGGRAQLNLTSESSRRAIELNASEGTRWRTVTITLPSTPGLFVEVLIRVQGSDLEIRDLRAT